MIYSPMPSGNGACILHQVLQKFIPNYQVDPYNSYLTLFPPSLYRFRPRKNSKIVHTAPDYGIFHARKNIPLILTFHNYVLDDFMQQYSTPFQCLHYLTDLKYFTRKSVEIADAITCVSSFTAQLVEREMGISDLTVIHNGVDEKMFVPLNRNKMNDHFKVLFSGNLSRRKGADLLPEIAGKLEKNIKIYYTQGLRTKSTLPDLPNLVPLKSVPYIDMPRLYQEMDILLFPSVREGLSLAALEAMASGLPLIATNETSFPELIDQEKGGYLCDLNNIDQFANRINQIAEDPALCQQMGEYNRNRIEESFSLDQMIEKYRALFDTFL